MKIKAKLTAAVAVMAAMASMLSFSAIAASNGYVYNKTVNASLNKEYKANYTDKVGRTAYGYSRCTAGNGWYWFIGNRTWGDVYIDEGPVGATILTNHRERQIAHQDVGGTSKNGTIKITLVKYKQLYNSRPKPYYSPEITVNSSMTYNFK